jgi:aromatic ring-opening dioxygenase LigB subunit
MLIPPFKGLLYHETSSTLGGNTLTLVYACIAPHGSEAIPELCAKSKLEKFRKTKNGLRQLAGEIANEKPDTIVIATPHNLKIEQKIAVVMAENSTGTLQASLRNKNSVSLKAKCDTRFARKIFESARKRRLPVVLANYGTAEGVTSDMPMDWGTLVPLWFILPQCHPKPKIVMITPSREIQLSENFRFGKVIGQLSKRTKSRIVFVASADQAHRHKRTGPYGFNKRAREYDRLVLDALERNEIDSIMNFDKRLVDAARPDSLWQMTILAGAIEGTDMRTTLLSYDVPTYFGMICASFQQN